MSKFDKYSRSEQDHINLVTECIEIAKSERLPLSWFNQDNLEYIQDDFDSLCCSCYEFRLMGIEDFIEFRDVDTQEEKIQVIQNAVESVKGGKKCGCWSDKLQRIVWEHKF